MLLWRQKHLFLFSFTDIQQHWRELWAGNFDLNSSLHLPAENKFIGGCLWLTSFNVVVRYWHLFQERLQLVLFVLTSSHWFRPQNLRLSGHRVPCQNNEQWERVSVVQEGQQVQDPQRCHWVCLYSQYIMYLMSKQFKKSLAKHLLTLLFSFSSSSICAFPPHITCGSEISKKVSWRSCEHLQSFKQIL